MANYTRYRTSPEDMPRRARERRQKKHAAGRRKWLWLKITLVIVFLLVIAVFGVAAGAIFALTRDLPSLDQLRRRTNPVNTVIYDRHGETIAVLHGAENRVLVKSRQIPDVMKEATVATEDERFYEHHGVDYQGVARAILENLRAGGVVQGGSTITEQYVKNAYVGSERTYTRKIREAALAWQLEDRWSKDKILTEYLNTVYYGAGAYGVEAASETYFHKHAKALNLQEAALLAALPKFPSEYSPTTDPKMAKQRRDLVLQLMAQQGYITPQVAAAKIKTKLHVYKHPLNPNNSLADYFTSYVTDKLIKHYGSRTVYEGGLKVYTSIDMEWQRQAIDVVKNETDPLYFGFKPSAALVAIDPRNGYIRTMVGGVNFKEQQFNLASQAKRQPGSSMKPFVLTAGILEGMDPYSTFYSSKSPIVLQMGPYDPPWQVSGDGPGGMESVAAATTISDNVVFAQLSMDVGPSNTVEVAHKMGITSYLDPVPSITLGTSGVSPLEMADAYATFASGGIHHAPQAIIKVKRSDGHVDWQPKTHGRRVISAGVASAVTKILETVTVPPGTGYATASYFPYPRAGKTGTAEDNADAWYCGYTPQLAAAVWMGNMDSRKSMGSTFGGTYCAPMWAKFFAAALKDQPHPSFNLVPYSFGSWHGKMQGASPSPSASKSKSPKPGATKTIAPNPTPTVTPTHTKTPTPTPTKTKTKPPTATPTAVGGKTVSADVALPRTGTGGTGLAGAVGSWLAGLFGF